MAPPRVEVSEQDRLDPLLVADATLSVLSKHSHDRCVHDFQLLSDLELYSHAREARMSSIEGVAIDTQAVLSPRAVLLVE